MSQVPPEIAVAREKFMDLVADLRPELHRYCSRLVGSSIDGEDVVQDALAKAFYALSLAPEVPPLRPWLFRIAHHTAIDLLRRYERRFVEPMAEPPDTAAEPADDVEYPAAARIALSSFLALPVQQRSAVILKDILGHSLDEVADTLGTSIPAVKAALSRGRSFLRAQPERDVIPRRDRPETSVEERALLERYVALFNARDWSSVRALLAEECRLDLVAKSARRGKRQVGAYFDNYARIDVELRLGRVEGRTVILAFEDAAAAEPHNMVAIEWQGDRVALIRDYRYVPYFMQQLDYQLEAS